MASDLKKKERKKESHPRDGREEEHKPYKYKNQAIVKERYCKSLPAQPRENDKDSKQR